MSIALAMLCGCGPGSVRAPGGMARIEGKNNHG
jgi:hypothetical protein